MVGATGVSTEPDEVDRGGGTMDVAAIVVEGDSATAAMPSPSPSRPHPVATDTLAASAHHPIVRRSLIYSLSCERATLVVPAAGRVDPGGGSAVERVDDQLKFRAWVEVRDRFTGDGVEHTHHVVAGLSEQHLGVELDRNDEDG